MYINSTQAMNFFHSFEWSSGTYSLFRKFFNQIALGKTSLSGRLLSTISDVLPIALSVAGAFLVVKLGWKLFKNFTKG